VPGRRRRRGSRSIVSSDPEHHVERIREIEKMGATVVCLQNGSGADPLGALRTYKDSVALKGSS
jgi:coenzyme F420-dependent glucose-6-phosphate dehydrogenase